ncbi:MAG TPA: chloride channel protein [Terriglobia bacterium]|nr:chloride channel protein [Terriglobia bacterium]
MTDPAATNSDIARSHAIQILHRYWNKFRSRFTKLRVPRLFLHEEGLFLLLAVIIGLFSGLAVVCFQISIDWTRIKLLGSSLAPGPFRVILVPALAGLAVAALVIFIFPRVRGSGVNQTKAAVYIYDGYIPFSTVLGKFVTCALAIGSGQSLGPEDPSLQIGAGIASALGRRLHLSREKVRLIAPVGAAAGLAAAFNAPISAVLFVIEEVIGKWSSGVLGAVVLSAVSSVTVLHLFLGEDPLFRVPPFHLVHPSELLSYAALGVIGGFASLAFIRLVSYLRMRSKAMPRWTHYIQPAAAGLLIGIFGVWMPQVMGAGYDIIDQALHDQFTWKLLALLAVFKILATSFSFSSGAPGGMFAPTLFIGAMIGGAVGGVEHIFFPHLGGTVGGFALVGMGVLFAGFMRVPMTSVFMVMELSGNYSIILPVMISNTIAYLISLRYQPVPLFDLFSRQDGTDLPSMEEQRERSTLLVEDAMRPPAEIVLRAEDTVADASRRVSATALDFFLVSHRNGDWTSVTKEDLRRLVKEGKGASPLARALSSPLLPWLHPDQPLDAALRQIGEWPILPVIHRADFNNLQGVVSIADILAAYGAANDEEEHGKAGGEPSVPDAALRPEGSRP